MLRERRRHAHYKLNSRLDRKSSRGMIYENEELRLRTININAEVEKGQSDIKRLRRENEHLRREIWTLRDECDRLNKRFKAKLAEYEKSDCSARESGGSSVSFLCDGLRYEDVHCGCNNDEFDCETCQIIDEQCKNCAYENCNQSMERRKMSAPASFLNGTANNSGKSVDKYDHLSVVSEETHSNLEASTQKVEGKHSFNSPAKKDQPPPRSPIEKFADEIADAQANIPPLSYFENVVERESHLAPAPEYETKNSHAWDHNIQSPFAIRKKRYENLAACKSENPIGWSVNNYVPTVSLTNGIAQAIEVVELKDKGEKNSSSGKFSNTHPCSTFLSTKTLQDATTQNGIVNHVEPPDVCVTNGLATPYQPHQIKEGKSNNIFNELKTSTDSEEISAENLESLLNDIENISEDICALQLQHQQQQELIDEHDNRMGSKSRNNSQQDYANLSHQYNNKKAFRSEMNLLLSFDGANTTFLPLNTNNVNLENCEYNPHPRTSSLGKDYEQSPLPCMPDPMTLFPENYGYLAHHKLKLDSLKNSANRLPNSDQNLHPTQIDAFPRPNNNTISQQNCELGNLVPNRSQLYASVQKKTKLKSIYNSHPFPLVSPDYIDSTSIEITPDSTKENTVQNAFKNIQKDSISTISPHTAASWSDIPTAVDTKNLKSFSYSTPNSPHTTRRNSAKQKTDEAQLAEKKTYSITPTLKSSLQEPVATNKQTKQRKNSRRYSDCSHLNSINPVVKGFNNNGHCHLHRHHHHIHRPSLIKNSNAFLRKDSHVETGTTVSDHQSNSFPSRESSISFNGVARKLSISSNKGGKIPWCGCWGNGCL